MKILIIEDEQLLADSIAEVLRRKGFEAEAVYDGETGAEYAELGVYDLLILDVMMPGLDGYTVARQVRARHLGTPILMLTARDDVSDKISGLDCGADDYMTKPFDTSELLAGSGPSPAARGRWCPRSWSSETCPSTSPPTACAGETSRCGWASRSSRCCVCFSRTPSWSPQGRHHCQGVGAGLGGGGQQCGGVHLLPAEEAGASPLPGEDPDHPHGGLLSGGAGGPVVFHKLHIFPLFHRVFDRRGGALP